MVPDVEMRVRHHHAAEQCGDRRLTVQRVCPVHNETAAAGFDGTPARILRVERRHHFVELRHLCGATAASDNPCGPRRVGVDAARHRKRLQEQTDDVLVIGLDDPVQRVLASGRPPLP